MENYLLNARKLILETSHMLIMGGRVYVDVGDEEPTQILGGIIFIKP